MKVYSLVVENVVAEDPEEAIKKVQGALKDELPEASVVDAEVIEELEDDEEDEEGGEVA
jgi:nitrogen regulatory protein PII-like uncharacterized protein